VKFWTGVWFVLSRVLVVISFLALTTLLGAILRGCESQ